MSEKLQRLLEQQPDIRRGWFDARAATEVVPSGHAALDHVLPGGGWPTRGLIEILIDHWGIGELELLMPALLGERFAGGWLTWIAPPCIPYAPALSARGIDLKRILLVHPRSRVDALWATEQALRSGTGAAVLAWLEQCSNRDLRRLQLAVETGRSWAVLFRPGRARSQASPAALRLELEPDEAGMRLHLLKSRSGHPATVRVGSTLACN